jgi:rhamnosyltransferase
MKIKEQSGLVSIVVRSFNEEKHIDKLLKGICNQSYEKTEIILVDSGSTDKTLEIAKQYPVKIVSINPENFTFGYSLNMGCREARGEYLVIASAHVYPVYIDWLETLIEILEDNSVGLVYGKQRGDETSRYSERQLFKKWFPENADYNQLHSFCNNANAAIKKQHWLENNYDENLTGLEDIAWASYMQKKGLKIIYEPRAEVKHLHDETFDRIYNRYRREAIALRQIYSDQKFTFIDFILLCAGNIISDWFHALEEKHLSNYILEIVQFRFCQFWGTYNGQNKSNSLTDELKKKLYYPKTYKSKVKRKEDKKKVSSPIKY